MGKSRKPEDRVFTWRDIDLPEVDITSEDTEDGRIYTDNKTGKKFWSVTTMLGKTSDKTWLKEWVARIGEEAAQKETERCCDRGDKIHLACELYVANKPLSEQVAAAGEYWNMYKQLRDCINTHVGEIVAAEIPVFSTLLQVGGRFDLLAEWRGKELALIDYKGSNHLKTKESIEDYKIQLCAYSYALEETYGIKVTKFVNIIANEKARIPTVISCTREEITPLLVKRIKKFKELVPPIN